jgi:hypothetical protein
MTNESKAWASMAQQLRLYAGAANTTKELTAALLVAAEAVEKHLAALRA